MEVQKIGGGSPPENRWTAAQQVQRLAEENAAAQLKTRGEPVAATPFRTDDSAYSPTLYAQAAQFQLYTQSGTLAALLAQSGAIKPDNTALAANKGDEVAAVDKSAAASRFDTKA